MTDSVADKQARLTKLKKARDSGVLSVTHQGVSTQFRTLKELERIIAAIESEIGAASGSVTRRTYLGYPKSKGL